MDKKIYKILKEWKIESKCDSIILFSYSYIDNILTVYTHRVGYLIGKEGKLFYKYFGKIKNEVKSCKELKLIEIKNNYVI